MTGSDSPPVASATADGVTPSPSAEQVREALARILASVPFSRSDRLRQFLTYVVEGTLDGRAVELKETVVAVDVFGRQASFDPRADSIVRLEARRLRDRLASYYDGPGADDPVRIDLPKGHYSASFAHRPRVEAHDPSAAPVVPAHHRPRTRRFGIVAAFAAALMVAVVAMLAWRGREVPPPATLAILPFDTANAGAELDRFAFGVVEDITTAVAMVDGIRVIARSSAFRYPGRGQDIAAVGRVLGATHIMEGSVRRQGERLRISAQLIRVADAQHVWAGTFDRRMGNAFDVQDAVAAAVAGAVSQALPGAAAARPRRAPPSAAAYELYLEGVALRGERTIDSITLARDRFERAVAADPRFAPAHAALGGVLAATAFHEQSDVANVLDLARASIDAALALDDTLAAAYATRAWIAFFADWDLHAAERDFRRALVLNPSLADTHNLYALMLMAQRRDDEALAHARAAMDLDPLSFTRANDVGVVMLGTGRPRDALDHAYRAVRASPTDRGARGLAGMSLAAMQRYDGAIREFGLALDRGPRYTYLLGGLGFARARTGDRDGARALAVEVEAACRAGTGSWVHLAYIHLALGDETSALGDLERAFEARDVDIVFLDAHPLLAPLRAHPAFRALRARVLP